MPLSEFKALVREQYFMLLIDKDACARCYSLHASAGCRDAKAGL